MVDNLGIGKIKKENKSKKIKKGEKMEKCFSLEEIKLAVDIAIGDDGFRGKEVCDILKVFWKEREEEACRNRGGKVSGKRGKICSSTNCLGMGFLAIRQSFVASWHPLFSWYFF